jgi:hypothetical protein
MTNKQQILEDFWKTEYEAYRAWYWLKYGHAKDIRVNWKLIAEWRETLKT